MCDSLLTTVELVAKFELLGTRQNFEIRAASEAIGIFFENFTSKVNTFSQENQKSVYPPSGENLKIGSFCLPPQIRKSQNRLFWFTPQTGKSEK